LSKKPIPAVSIIIPMYNAEKYIGECLESILAQTFQEFEVIVVDDCSTDNSRAVVESYKPNFGDKLQLINRAVNSGNPGPPTNDGMILSRGEYLLLVDNDDAITPTALEELVSLAKKFDADVVHCKRYYRFPADKKFSDVSARVLNPYLLGGEEDPPELLSENIIERLPAIRAGRFFQNLWTKLIRRDFILQNRIELINGMAQDMLVTTCLLLTAPKYLLVPNSVNLYRVVTDSLSHSPKTLEVHLQKWVGGMIRGFNYFDKFLSERQFFQENPTLKFTALDIWVNECCKYLTKLYAQFPVYQLDELLRKEFVEAGDTEKFAAFLFSRMSIFNLKFNQQNQMIENFKAQAGIK